MSVEECPNCGGPLRDGKCNYCEASELAKNIWNEGKCRNCGASLRNNLIKDQQNQFVCRYCGWPVRDRPAQDLLRPSPSTPPDDNAPPPNSPAATIQASNPTTSASFMPEIMDLVLIVFMVFIGAMLIGSLSSTIAHISSNITSTNHTVDVPSYTPGTSVILIGVAFVAGIGLTFLILRNRHKRELARQQRLLGGNRQ